MPIDELVAQLVAIESTNPDLGEGAGEEAIARFVMAWFRERGVEAWLQGTGREGRPNVIARVGPGSGPTLMLNAHLDTVGLGTMADPLQPQPSGRRLRGRGAMDTKGGLAALMTATADAGALDLGGTVLFTGVADEEYASIGTRAVVAEYTADGAIVAEPSGLDLVIAHKGFLWFEVETAGFAAHGSMPEVGVDAIAAMGRVLLGIAAIDAELAERPVHPLLGRGSIHAGLIAGGQELSSYPSRCVLSLERRTLPGETGAQAEAEIQAVLDDLAGSSPGFTAVLRRILERDPYEIDQGHPFVQLVAGQTASRLGAARLIGHGAWMDSSILSASGIPAVIIGPGGEGLHGDDEWVDLDSVAAMTDVVMGVVAAFCR